MAPLALPTTWLMSWVFVSLASGIERRKLVWSDEFNDEELDRTKWVVLYGDGCNTSLGCGWGRGQLDVSLSSNTRLQDGHLVITAGLFGNGSLSPSDPPTSTSARLSTFGSADFLHGRVEVRAKMPSGGWGGWGGIWLIPSKQTLEEQASCARVDVAEVNDFTLNTAIASLHFGEMESGCKSSEEWPEDGGGCIFSPSGTSGTLSESFHVYAVEWEKGEFRWFVDEWHYCTKRRWFSDADPFPAPFNASFHVEMALAVGGGRGNIRVDDVDLGALPQELLVDYVRISQGASGSMQVSPADFSSSESRSGSRTSRLSSVVLVALALAACVAGPYMAVTGPSRPRANVRMMGIEIGAFKASNVIHILSKSDAVALGACIPFGLFSGYLAVRHRTVARWNTVAGLAVPSLLLLIDLGIISDIGSRYVGWAIFFVLTVTFAVLTCPPEHHIIAFSVATAATGGCVLKLGLGHLLGTPGEIFKILDDPLGDRCYVSRTCRSLTLVSATTFLVGLCAQRWFARLDSKLENGIDHECDDNAMFTPPREGSSRLSMVKSNSRQKDLVARTTEGFMPAEPTGHTGRFVCQQGRQTFPRDALAAETARWGGVLTTVSRTYQRVLEPVREAPGSAPPIENATGSPTPVPIPLAGLHGNTTVSNQGDTIELVIRSPMKVVRSKPSSRGGAMELDNNHGGAPRAKSQRQTGSSESGKEPTSGGPNNCRSSSTPGEKRPSSLPSSGSGSSMENARIVSGSLGGSFRGRLAQVFSDKWGAWRDIDEENLHAATSGRCARDFDHEALLLSPYDPYPSSPRASSSGSSSSSTQPIYEAWTSQKSDKHSPSSEAADPSTYVPPVHTSKKGDASIAGNSSGVVPAESSLAGAASQLSPRLGPTAAFEDPEKRRRGPVADAGSCVSVCEGHRSAGRRTMGDKPNHQSSPDISQRDDKRIRRLEPRRGSRRNDSVQPTGKSGGAPGNSSPESSCEKNSARFTVDVQGTHVEGRRKGQGAAGTSRSTRSPLLSQQSPRRDEMKPGVRVTSRDEVYGPSGDVGKVLDEDGVTRSVSRGHKSSRRSSGKPKLKDVDLL